MGYLICDKCGGYYELSVGETPDDFSDQCECGGTLKFTKEKTEKMEYNTSKRIKLEWKPIIYSILLALILGGLFGLLGSWLYLIGYLIATIYVGYITGGDYKRGVIYGIIVGLIVSIILNVIDMILMSQLLEYGITKFGVITALSPLIENFVLTVVIAFITGAVGGLIGVFIRGWSLGVNWNNNLLTGEFTKKTVKRNLLGILIGIVFFVVSSITSLELLIYTIVTHYGTTPLIMPPSSANIFVLFLQIAIIFVLTIISGAITTYINKSREFINGSLNCLILGIIIGISVDITLHYGIPLVFISSCSAILGGWIVISFRKYFKN